MHATILKGFIMSKKTVEKEVKQDAVTTATATAIVEQATAISKATEKTADVKIDFKVDEKDFTLEKYGRFAKSKLNYKVDIADFTSRKGLIANIYARVIASLLAKKDASTISPNQVNALYMQLGGSDIRVHASKLHSYNDSTQHQGMHCISMGLTKEIVQLDAKTAKLTFARSILANGKHIFPICSKTNSVSFKNNSGGYERLPNMSADDYSKLSTSLEKIRTTKSLIQDLEVKYISK